MIIDYTRLDEGTIPAIQAVEGKGHVKYIRYLLSKRTPPGSIRKELARLALSAPTKETLVTYFTTILWPMLIGFGIQKYYQEYLDRLVKGEQERDVSPIFKFDIVFTGHDADRIPFCLFLRELEVDDMWSREITRYYGGIQNIPQGPDGARIIACNTTRSVESILTCPRRHVVDQLLLESVSPARIVKYMMEKHQIKLNEGDLYAYAKHFFNFERRGLEEIINNLVTEQASLKSDLSILDKNDDYSLGDKATMAQQYEAKIAFLDDCIRSMNAKYNDVTYRQGISEKLDLEEMMNDIVRRGYERFVMLDRYKDRDIVRPITDVAKMVFNGVERLSILEDKKIQRGRELKDRDKSAQEVLLDLYQASYDKYIADNLNKHPELALETPEGDELDGGIMGLDEV